MEQRTKGLLMLFLLFGILLTICGISGFASRTKDYTPPIYISQELTMTLSSLGDVKTLRGQISNRTNEDVCIETLKIYVSGGTKRNTVYSYLTYNNIIIPANSFYNINQTNIKTSFNRASISECTINGEKNHLLYSSDGIIFENSSNNVSTSTLMLIISFILLLSSAGIVINYFIKKKQVKY